MRQTLAAIRHLETAVLQAPGIDGVVLRYANLYGPGTGFAGDGDLVAQVRKRKVPIVGRGGGIWSFVHVDDAAAATVAAIEHGRPGVYNVADDEPASTAVWLPELADTLGARPPRRVPAWLGRLAAGDATVSMFTQIRGAANGKAKRELSWAPRHGAGATASGASSRRRDRATVRRRGELRSGRRCSTGETLSAPVSASSSTVLGSREAPSWSSAGRRGSGSRPCWRMRARRLPACAYCAAAGSSRRRSCLYAGLHQILRPVLGDADGLPPPQARALRGALGLESGASDEWFLVSLAVLSLLAEAAEHGPLLCLVDDAHWLDDASAESLVFAGRRLEAEGVVILFAARDGDVRSFEAPEFEELRLGGLDADASAALLDDRVPARSRARLAGG